MRIVIDLQAAQTDSRFRGIGHYSTEFAKALVRTSPNHEILLALNGLFPDTIEPIRAEFDGILPQDQIRVWHTVGPIEHFGDGKGNHREIAEAMREFFLRSLEPDLILISSIFEGLGDGAVITAKKFVTDVPVAAISYDLTPLHMPDEQFQTNPVYRRWYRNRIDTLRRCDLLLAISESSREEVIEQVGVRPENIVNVLGGHNDTFSRRNYQSGERTKILRSFGITKPFILYAGGVEPSKNLKRLVESLSYLPDKITKSYEFVCVGKRNPGEIELIESFARAPTARQMIKTVGFVTRSELVDLYNLSDIFVFPSLREGFGLPPLEAMACGAPTVVSDRTSLPEVVDNPDALFDPLSPNSIAQKITKVLSDRGFRDKLVERGLERASELTWEATASKAASAIADRFGAAHSFDNTRRTVLSHTSLFKPNRKRIIVQKLDHHGDFLLALPAMAKLRSRYPEAQIDALVGTWNRPAAEASGLFDQIHVLDFFKAKSSVPAALDADEFSQVAADLGYYDYAIDLRRQSDTRFILTKLKAEQYFGYRSGDERIDHLLTNPLEIHPDDGGVRSYFDETHTCVQMLKIIDALPFDANDYLKLPDLGQRMPVERGSVAIFPRVGNDARQWDTRNFEALIQRLDAHPRISKINLFCGRAAELEDLKLTPSVKIRIHAGLPFRELFSALSSNEVCVGNNSLGVHLAGYAGCRTIGIYSGHELPQQWGPPFGDSVAITVDASCAPCHLPDRQSCPFDTFCLDDISVETVETAIFDALDQRPIVERYSRITRVNPASAIKPLVDAFNKSKFVGNIEGLGETDRVALAAAVSINFPERPSGRNFIYLDVSGLLEQDALARSNRQFKKLRETIDVLTGTRSELVIPIATGQHDHEFYAVELENLDESLFGRARFERIVTPLAGDVYIGAQSYLDRNDAQWNLLMSWREMGVRTIFTVPQPINFDELNQEAAPAPELSSYLFTIAHFDALLVPEKQCSALCEWIDEYGPRRLRPLVCGSDLLSLIEPQSREQAGVVNLARAAQEPERRSSSSTEVRDRSAMAERKKA